MSWDRKIPFSKATGCMLHYAESGIEARLAVWKELYEFDATLRFEEFARGRSAVYAWMKDDAGLSYPLSLNDFEQFVPTMIKGRIPGRWTFKKQGQNFFITPVSRKVS